MAVATTSTITRFRHILTSVPGALAGPILTKELRVSSRRRRNYVLRAAYLAALTVFVVLVWLASVRWDSHGDYADRINRMAEAGKIIIACIAWFQFIVIQIVTVIMLSTSISEEVYAKTLGVLMTTPINSFQIVVGKLFSKILQLLILLAASLPMLAVLRVLGGVPWDFVVNSLCVTLTTALLVASVTMFFSILFRWAFVSILMSLGSLAVVYGLVPLILGLLVAAAGLHDEEIIMPLVTVLINYNPVIMLTAMTEDMFRPGSVARNGPRGGMFFFAWWVNCLISLGLASLILTACVAMVRRVGMRLVAGATGAGASSAAAIAASAGAVPAPAQQIVGALLDPGPALGGTFASPPVLEAVDTSALAASAPAAAPPAAPPAPLPTRRVKVRQITGSPIIWRELRSTWLKRGVLYWVLLGVGLWLLLMIYALVAITESDSYRYGLTHAAFIVVYTIIGAICTAVLAATNITSEKESRSWELLLCTPLGDWHILLAKFVGALRRCLPIWLLPIGHILLFTLTGCCHVALLPMYLLIVSGVVFPLAGAGLYFGSRFRRTTTAVMLNFALGLGLWVALPGARRLLGEAMPSDGFRDEFRQTTEFIIDANPVFQAGMVTERIGGDGFSFFESRERDWSSITFRWAGMGEADLADSLAYLAFLASLNVVLAAFLAWRAKCQFRKRWF
jgi:ABC-type transport system involved in multi-copper enzyme maturation permease subunit